MQVQIEFQDFCSYLDINHAVLSLYIYHTKGKREARIKFIKGKIKKCFQTNADTYMAMIDPIWPRPETLLFNSPEISLLIKFTRPLTLFDNGDSKHIASIKRRVPCKHTYIYLQKVSNSYP